MNSGSRVPSAPRRASTLRAPFRPSDGAVLMTKAQRKSLAELSGTADYSVEATKIRGAIAAVSSGSRSTVFVIAGNGKVTEF